jgi:hypothetical protein
VVSPRRCQARHRLPVAPAGARSASPDQARPPQLQCPERSAWRSACPFRRRDRAPECRALPPAPSAPRPARSRGGARRMPPPPRTTSRDAVVRSDPRAHPNLRPSRQSEATGTLSW